LPATETIGPYDLAVSKMSPVADHRKTNKTEVVDSWEDEEVESDEDPPVAKETAPLRTDKDIEQNSGARTTTSTTKTNVDDLTDLLSSHSPFYGSPTSTGRQDSSHLEKRPEKTMSTANRMIGAALGMRIRQTDEQRKAHKALIESEKKRRAEEKEKKAQEEKAKRSVWEDS